MKLPDIDDPLAQRRQLSSARRSAATWTWTQPSCHHPLLAGDGLAVGVGVGAVEPDLLGPGRARPDGLANVPRNAADHLQHWLVG
ncbi:MAG: hypothetical protein R2844_15405 [Caldilineales bacterium]